MLVGFFFGIVTGYETPKPTVVAKAPKENLKPVEKVTPKVTPEPQPAPQPSPPDPPKVELTPKVEPPKVEPPKVDTPPPMKIEPKMPDLVPVSFKADIVPILRSHCYDCHGGGKGKPKGDIDLTSIASMMKSPGKIVVPGRPEQSDVYTSITERDMPDQGRPKPKPQELMKLRNWILQGAKERRRTTRGKRATRFVCPG